MGKYHCPFCFGNLSPQFAVYKVCNPTEKNPGCAYCHYYVGERPEAHFARKAVRHYCGNYPDESAVACHAPFPYVKNGERIFAKSGEVVKQHIPEPSADYHPEQQVCYECGIVVFAQRAFAARRIEV